jgi:hypothetical protein
MVPGKRSLFGAMISASTLSNSLCTYSFTPIVVLNNCVPETRDNNNIVNCCTEVRISTEKTSNFALHAHLVSPRALVLTCTGGTKQALESIRTRNMRSCRSSKEHFIKHMGSPHQKMVESVWRGRMAR